MAREDESEPLSQEELDNRFYTAVNNVADKMKAAVSGDEHDLEAVEEAMAEAQKHVADYKSTRKE
jgi:hypothetical protein